jgi:ABC-type Fe3+-hydroxamate transport system substrate-binding protein
MTPDRIAREIALWSALPSVPAVRNKRTYLVANEVLMVPGPRVVEGIRLMTDVLHPPR